MKGFPRKVVGATMRDVPLGEGTGQGAFLKLECGHEIQRGKGPRTVQCGQCRFENSCNKEGN